MIYKVFYNFAPGKDIQSFQVAEFYNKDAAYDYVSYLNEHYRSSIFVSYTVEEHNIIKIEDLRKIYSEGRYNEEK